MIDRHKFVEELKLRKQIRKAVKIVKENRKKKADQVLLEETQLRKYIRKLLVEGDTAKPEESPHQKTGINALEALLHNIIPQIKDEFLQLTTSEEQRTSFRRHMIYNVMGLLKPPTVNDAAPGTPPAVAGAEEKFIAITEQEDIELTLSKDYITIEGQNEKENRTSFYSRSVYKKYLIPQNINRDKIEAQVKNGILKIKFPKIENKLNKKRTIKID